MDTQVVAYSEEGDGPSTGKARHPWPLSNPTRPRREMSFAERLEEARPHIELMARVFAQYHSPTPFLAIDLDQLTQSYHLWERTIGAPPHYAVKCNDAPAFLLHLDTLGSLFDAASGGELRQLVNDLGIPGEKIIATHPSRGRL